VHTYSALFPQDSTQIHPVTRLRSTKHAQEFGDDEGPEQKQGARVAFEELTTDIPQKLDDIGRAARALLRSLVAFCHHLNTLG